MRTLSTWSAANEDPMELAQALGHIALSVEGDVSYASCDLHSDAAAQSEGRRIRKMR